MNQACQRSPKAIAAVLSLVAIVLVGAFFTAEKTERISSLPAAMRAAKWPLYEITWALGDANEGEIVRFAPRPKHLPNAEIHQLLVDFKSAELDRVMNAAAVLRKHPRQSVPILVELLDSNEIVELTENEAMYNYNFFGRFKWYELQSYQAEEISAHAVWLLEKIAFQDFRASYPSVMSQKIEAAREYARAKRRGEPEEVLRRMRIEMHQPYRSHKDDSALRAKQWWKSQKGEFNEFDAIVAALNSDDPRRVEDVFRSFVDECNYIEGLTEKTFHSEILPVFKRYAHINEEHDPYDDLKDYAQRLLAIYRDNGWSEFQREYLIIGY